MTLPIPQIVATYIDAWNETDPGKRMALLDEVWAKDGTYQDPNVEVKGREGLSKLIGGFQAGKPGVALQLTDPPSSHHEHVYFGWQMAAGPGRVVGKGFDFVTLDRAGQISQIVGFFIAPAQGD